MAVVEQQMTSLDASNSVDDGEEWRENLGLGASAEGSPSGEATPQGSPGEPKPKEPTPDDHPTKLGRRVSRMEEVLGGLSDRFDTLFTKLDEDRRGTRRDSSLNNPQVPQDEDLPEHVRETVELVERRRATREQQERVNKQQYSETYLKAAKGIHNDDVDEDLHREVLKELTEVNYQSYMMVTGNPQQDAKINYGLALANTLNRQRLGKKTAPNVRGDRNTAPTDISSGSHMSPPSRKPVELDEFSRKYLGSLGAKEDDEWVQKSLGGTNR